MPDILLVDDHLVIITGLKTVIENSFTQCTTDIANDSITAFEKIKQHDYDLIIMDVSLPNTDTLQLISNILAIKPGARILMFSMNSEVIFAKRYLRMGAMGYISKDAPLSEIIKAIENILNEGRYLSNNMKEKLAMDEIEGNNKENQFENLSPREFEIVQHLVQGESVSAISKKLNLHTSTIGTHKARIFEKLKCQNIIDLVMLAKMNNIIM